MSAAVFDQILTHTPFPAAHQEAERPGGLDIWSSIQCSKQKEPAARSRDVPYIHPLIRRSSSVLSQKSLEICTESLGSESGSNDFFSSDDESNLFSAKRQRDRPVHCTERLLTYHRSMGSRRSLAPRRSFPPPLPSISCRDGPCLQMRPHRREGRLVVEAVPVPAQNYLQAERQGGRLILSFINAVHVSEEQEGPKINHGMTKADQEEEEEEEEVEVVERRTVVEVKVSTQPQQNTTKVHRSSIVINKFVSGNEENYAIANNAPSPPSQRLSTATTTAAAAAVAASSVGATSAGEGCKKLLFISKRKNREELLMDMRRCSQLRKPLFIWEPCRIATSS